MTFALRGLLFCPVQRLSWVFIPKTYYLSFCGMNSAVFCRMAEAHPLQIGQALKDSLLQAVSEDRVVRGVMSCAKLLEVSPECVMVCILPASVPSHDVTFHIQQTLVEAFCVEHAIPILKIGDLEKLAVIFAGRKDVANSLENNQDEGEGDLTCLLVQVPEVKSPADQFVMEFCEMIFLPHPRIDLPA